MVYLFFISCISNQVHLLDKKVQVSFTTIVISDDDGFDLDQHSQQKHNNPLKSLWSFTDLTFLESEIYLLMIATDRQKGPEKFAN